MRKGTIREAVASCPATRQRQGLVSTRPFRLATLRPDGLRLPVG